MTDAQTLAARWTASVRRVWRLRGAPAAFAPIALLTSLLPLSGWAALRAVRRSWRGIAGAVGALTGRLPGIPEIDAAIVTPAISTSRRARRAG